MSLSAIEGQLGKTLRKANRVKGTRAKLDRIDDMLARLHGLLAPLSALPADALNEAQRFDKHRVEGLIELCRLHKLKFQLDAVLASVRAGIQRVQNAPDLQTADSLTSLAARLCAVLRIDAEYAEARELLHELASAYPQYVSHTEPVARVLDISPYQAPNMRIAITCRKADIESHDALKARYPLYHVPEASAPDGDEKTACHLRFSMKDLDDFGRFHEELRTRPGYRILINGRAMPEQPFSDWFHCYMRFRKAGSPPQYCYGASPFTFNVFGCHKLYAPDLAKQIDACWFSQGKLDNDSGMFFVDVTQVIQRLTHQLQHCGVCPALTQEKISLGLNILPAVLNPEYDERWRYWPPHRVPERVIPAGDELVIAPAHTDFTHIDPTRLIEVAPTPSLEKILRYLHTGEMAALGSQAHRGLSLCLHCGIAYKAHTMTCGTCRVDFWKYALQDLDQALGALRSVTPISLPSLEPSASPSGSRSTPAASRAAARPSHDSADAAVSFDQLWSDPQVQQMLTPDPPPSPQAAPQGERADESAPAEAPARATESSSDEVERYRESLRAIAQQKSSDSEERPLPLPDERVQFHEKIWSLMSKKYRERKAIETAFSASDDQPRLSGEAASPFSPPSVPDSGPAVQRHPTAASESEPASSGPRRQFRDSQADAHQPASSSASAPDDASGEFTSGDAALLKTIKSLKTRKKSELSKRGVVRVIYLATMDTDTCPLCAYLDGMVMDPDDPATEIFSPPLYPGCTCRREYVLKTEKPQNWPRVTFKFPPKDLLSYLDK